MQNKYKILILLLIVLPLGYFALGKNNSSNQVSSLKNRESAEGLVAVSSRTDLGEIEVFGGKVKTIFNFTNEGDEPVLVLSGETSCMCTEAVIKTPDNKLSPVIKMPGHGATPELNKVIKPGESAELIATYDPLAHGPNANGPIMRSIILKTNSIKTPEIIFSFQGNVVNN